MLSFSDALRVFVAIDPCDMRKGFNLNPAIEVDAPPFPARNALTRAVFFHRLGELRYRTYENQRHRA